MFRQFVILAAASGIAACAASDPGPAPAAESKPSAPTEQTRTGEEEKEIDVAKVPAAETSAVVLNRNERICRNEKRTGTNRVTRVCRTRAEIEQLETEGKRVFEELHESQVEYD